LKIKTLTTRFYLLKHIIKSLHLCLICISNKDKQEHLMFLMLLGVVNTSLFTAADSLSQGSAATAVREHAGFNSTLSAVHF